MIGVSSAAINNGFLPPSALPAPRRLAPIERWELEISREFYGVYPERPNRWQAHWGKYGTLIIGAALWATVLAVTFSDLRIVFTKL